MDDDRQHPAQNVTRTAQEPVASPRPAGLIEYVELAPLISLAVDAVVYVFDIDEDADVALVDQLTATASTRTLDLYRPMAEIATQAARAARRSREVRAQEVARTAQAMATQVAETAAALQVHDEMRAVTVAQASAAAAGEVVAGADLHEAVERSAGKAAQVLAVVRAAAAAAVQERAEAALLIAHAAAASAAEVSLQAEMQDVALELEASATAAAVRALALDFCYQAALEAAATAAEDALSHRASPTLTQDLAADELLTRLLEGG